MRRRSAIAALGAGLASLAGCVATPSNAQQSGDLPELVDHEVRQYRVDYPMVEEAPGEVDIYASRDAAEGAIDPAASVQPDAVRDLLESTEFDSERLLYVASESPTPTHREIRVGNLGVDTGTSPREGGEDLEESAPTVVGGAAIRQSVEEEEVDGDGPIGASALVRARFDRDPPDQAVITVQDGWLRQGSLAAVADE